MKKINIVIALVVIILCLVGWYSMINKTVSDANQVESYIEEADDWAARGLYQRAIGNYKLALESDPAEEVYEKAVKAYMARYEEAREDTLEDYMDFLEEAVAVYPGNILLVDQLVSLYQEDGDYDGIYYCLANAVANGYDTASVRAQMRAARYAFTLRRNEFTGLRQSAGEFFTAARNGKWNLYSTDSGYVFSSEYDYAGLSSEDGTIVVTGQDSRLLDSTGLVLGIFENIVTDAGIFSDGLVPASFGGTYSYYNEFAEKQFGSYEQAGTFQNGMAAVKTNGKWVLINTEGEEVSDSYDEIVLDAYGRYIIDDTILVKTSAKEYTLYNSEWEAKATLNCSEVDCYTQDGLIAVCKDGLWGFMDTEGQLVIQPEYSQAKSFSNGLAAVCKDGLWGFIDPQNNLVIDCQFSDVGYVTASGHCPVRTDLPAETEEAQEPDDAQGTDEAQSGEIPELPQSWRLLQLTLGIITDEE